MKKLAILLGLLAAGIIAGAASAQTVNPQTGITWPRVTGAGAPTSTCPSSTNTTTTATVGTPYTNTTTNTQYVCGSAGWVLLGSGSGVTQIVPGTNISITPSGGTGVVTINSTGGNGSVTFAASLTALGDSIPAGFLLSSPSTQSYPALMASTFGISLNNYAVSGDMACDVFRTQIYPNSITSGQDAAPIGTLGVGTNDADVKGTGAYEATFNSCYQAVQAWMLTPSEYTVLAGNVGNSVTGTCSNTPNSGVFGGAICGAGAGTITFTTPALGTLYGFWYYVDDTLSGTNCFTYQVDSGTVSSCIPAVLTPHMATQNGGAASIAWFPITGASANTAHTVRFSTTVGTIAILGVALVPPQPFFQHQVLASSDIPNQKTPPNASVPTQVQYSLDISNNVAYFKGLGFDARYVPTRNYMLATTAEMNDTLHPAFPLGTEHMASAFKETLQATPGGACQVNCTFTGITTLDSGVTGSSVIKSNVAGAPSAFVQNQNVSGYSGFDFKDSAGTRNGGVGRANASNSFFPNYVYLYTNSSPMVIGDIFNTPAIVIDNYPLQVPKFNFGFLGQATAPSGVCGSGTSINGEWVPSQTGVLTWCNAGTWTTFGGGGGAVASVSNSDGTLTVTPTTGAVVASLNLAHANTWTATQTFSGSGTPLSIPSSKPTVPAAGTAQLGTDSSGDLMKSDNNAAQIRVTGTTAAGTAGHIAIFGTNGVDVSDGGAVPTGAVASVSNSDSTLTISPTTGVVVGSLNIGHANIWTATQSINLTGSTHPTLPANTIDFTANVNGSSTRRVSSSFGATSFFSILRADGTATSPTQVLAGEQVGGINAWAWNGTGYNGPIASFRTFADENQTTSAAGSRIDFTTTPDGSLTALSRVSIENDGRFIIAGLTPSTSAICPHGTGGALTTVGCAASGTVGGGTSGWSGTPLTFISSTTQYAPPVGGALTSTTESVVQNAAPAAATLSGLQVTLSAALGAGATLQVTLRDAASGTTLTCTTTSGGTTCSDITHSVNVTQGDLLDFQLVSSGTVTAGVPQIVVSYAVGTSNVGLTSFASGNLSPIFTTSVATSTTTPVQSFTLTNAAANKFLGNNTGSTGAPAYVSIGASDWSPNDYIVGAGSVNAMTATLVPAATAWTAGLRFQVLPNLANTGAATINVNGLGAKTIVKKGGMALIANDYITTQIADFQYDGTNVELMNPQTVTAGGGISSYCAGRGYVSPAAVASGTTNYYACQNFSTSSAVSTATVIANAGTSGCSATFNIDATTTNTVSLTFQWQKASAGSTTFSNIGSALILAASTSVSTQTVSFSGATAVGDRIVIQVSLPVGTTIGTSQMTNPSMVCN